MTLLLLDTTFLIDAERGATGLDNLIDDDDDVAIAAITLAELTVGVELAAAPAVTTAVVRRRDRCLDSDPALRRTRRATAREPAGRSAPSRPTPRCP